MKIVVLKGSPRKSGVVQCGALRRRERDRPAANIADSERFAALLHNRRNCLLPLTPPAAYRRKLNGIDPSETESLE